MEVFRGRKCETVAWRDERGCYGDVWEGGMRLDKL